MQISTIIKLFIKLNDKCFSVETNIGYLFSLKISEKFTAL